MAMGGGFAIATPPAAAGGFGIGRSLCIVLAFALLSTWASAQNANGPTTAADHLGLMKSNRKLLEELIEEGVRLGDANTNLERAADCQSVANRLGRELKRAIDLDDADRVVEMSDHFSALIQSGFLPNLESAKESIPLGSPDYPRLVAIHTTAANSLDAVKSLIPTEGKLSKIQRVRAARIKLEAAATAVGKPEKE